LVWLFRSPGFVLSLFLEVFPDVPPIRQAHTEAKAMFMLFGLDLTGVTTENGLRAVMSANIRQKCKDLADKGLCDIVELMALPKTKSDDSKKHLMMQMFKVVRKARKDDKSVSSVESE
jgi:hypothetical protein